MNPIPFAGVTQVMSAPQHWDEQRLGECLDLPVMKEGNTYTSLWEPTPDERAALVLGGAVLLTIVGLQPPVRLEVVIEKPDPDVKES